MTAERRGTLVRSSFFRSRSGRLRTSRPFTASTSKATNATGPWRRISSTKIFFSSIPIKVEKMNCETPQFFARRLS
jgi:hypothetical protein